MRVASHNLLLLIVAALTLAPKLSGQSPEEGGRTADPARLESPFRPPAQDGGLSAARSYEYAENGERIEPLPPLTPNARAAADASTAYLEAFEQETAGRHPDAVSVFHCGFEFNWDEDYNGWPDRWTRKRSADFPLYLPISIREEPAPERDQVLRMRLNGGSAAIHSPAIEVGTLFSYVLEGYVNTEGLQNSYAHLSIDFLDADRKIIETHKSRLVQSPGQWSKVRLGPFTPPREDCATATIGLHLEPNGLRGDLRGSAAFDDLWLARLPRMTLDLSKKPAVYATGETIEAKCTLSGLFDRDPVLKLELIDQTGLDPAGEDEATSAPRVAELGAPVSLFLKKHPQRSGGYVGSTSWSPPVDRPGFYLLRATLTGDKGIILQRQQTLAVMDSRSQPQRGEFGWTLEAANGPLTLAELTQFVPQLGVNWIKYPVWQDENCGPTIDQMASFTERMKKAGVEVVGLLCNPPESARAGFSNSPTLHAADIFTTEPEVWYRPLEPILTRLSLQIRYWQLGADDDQSFVGFSKLESTLAAVKKQLQRFGQVVYLGVPWNASTEEPQERRPAWDFVALAARPELTADEIAAYLPSTGVGKGRHWATLAPLPRGEYALSARVGDFVRRLLAAKIHGASAIFLSRPFDDLSGVMRPDGSPGELLLPWRTTASAVAGADYLGSLTLPTGATNHVFVRGGEAVVVLWNETPREERLYLGPRAYLVDAWGRRSSFNQMAGEHILSVGPEPIFAVGVSVPVVRMMLDLQFAKPNVPNIFGVAHANSVLVTNRFEQGVSGRLVLNTPEAWKTYPRVSKFKLASGETLNEPFTIALPYDASCGEQKVKIDIEVNTDQHHRFSVYRSLSVGSGDITLAVTTRLNNKGELEVEQVLENNTDDQLTFKCMLFAPSRKRLVSQVIRQGRGRDVKTYRLPRGEELIDGTLWVRAEESGGGRIINQRVIVTR